MDDRSKKYLDTYLATLSEMDRLKHTSFSADCFCADVESANICSDLIRRGIKVAGCSMKYWVDSGKEHMPEVGHLQVVTDWFGEPSSIIEITSVSECRFCDVDEAFAMAEGEGDQSLAWWREAHWEYFKKECDGLGIEPSEEMVLIKERFKVVYRGL